MSKNRGPISKRLVEEFGLAAADNDFELVAEARLLHDKGHRARAYELAVLAAEELEGGRGEPCAEVGR